MAKIKLGAKIIADRRKADANLEYIFVPDIKVEIDGEMVDNKDLGDDAIKLRKRYLTEAERMSMSLNADATIAMPLEKMWYMTVIEVIGVDGADGKPISVDDIPNAVGAPLAGTLLVVSFSDSIQQSQLSEDERKN